MWTACDLLALTGHRWSRGSACASWTGTDRIWYVSYGAGASPDAFALSRAAVH